MHTEEEYEGASLGLTREEALRQVKEQAQKRAQHLKDFIFTHGEHCSDAELYDAQGELDQLEKHDNTACRAALAPNIVCGRARWMLNEVWVYLGKRGKIRRKLIGTGFMDKWGKKKWNW